MSSSSASKRQKQQGCFCIHEQCQSIVAQLKDLGCHKAQLIRLRKDSSLYDSCVASKILDPNLIDNCRLFVARWHYPDFCFIEEDDTIILRNTCATNPDFTGLRQYKIGTRRVKRSEPTDEYVSAPTVTVQMILDEIVRLKRSQGGARITEVNTRDQVFKNALENTSKLVRDHFNSHISIFQKCIGKYIQISARSFQFSN
jgi:hypothetical protein